MSSENLLLNQLSLLLAGSGMSDDQMTILINHLKNVPTYKIIDQINLHRSHYDENNRKIGFRKISSSESIGHSKNHVDAIDNVQRLLISEAGMSKNLAAHEILIYLKSRHQDKKFPSFNSKEGFSKWLSSVAEIISLSELLHVASVLRNRLVHTSNDDWIKGKNQ